jgi:hypothetical protein
MSTPEKMPFATTHEACAASLALFSGPLYALTRLNADTCRSVFSGAALHWENVCRAQTPEQFITRQAESLPWLAMQFSGYARGWMDIASAAAASLSRSGSGHHDRHALHLTTTLDGMTRCAQGVDAMLRALNPVAGAPASAG